MLDYKKKKTNTNNLTLRDGTQNKIGDLDLNNNAVLNKKNHDNNKMMLCLMNFSKIIFSYQCMVACNSPHTYNKKVYSLLLTKDPQNNYNFSRIGFNFVLNLFLLQ